MRHPVRLWSFAATLLFATPGLRAQPAGEDVGAPLPPLATIHQHMKRSGELLQLPGTLQQAPTAQQQAADALQRWIAAAREAAGASPAGGAATTTNSQEPANNGGQPDTEPRAPIDSEPPPREGLRGVWGHLPNRLRTEMRAGGVERFLPQYESEIVQFYKRLAEQEAGRP